MSAEPTGTPEGLVAWLLGALGLIGTGGGGSVVWKFWKATADNDKAIGLLSEQVETLRKEIHGKLDNHEDRLERDETRLNSHSDAIDDIRSSVAKVEKDAAVMATESHHIKAQLAENTAVMRDLARAINERMGSSGAG